MIASGLLASMSKSSITMAMRRAVRELLVVSVLEERRLREAGAGRAWEDACDAVDGWIDRERTLAGVTDPGAANRWKALGGDLDGEDPE